ncbi:MAG TPA: hypothetical protein VGM90_27190 [Kofleriaceae bacterium]|jgi:hypothetical protein
MRQLGLFVALVGLCACEKHETKTEVKIEKKTDDKAVIEEKKTVAPAPDPGPAGGATNPDAPLGFWKIDTIDGDDGKPVNLGDMMKKQWASQGLDSKLEFMRMTLKIEPTKLTLGNDMVTGAKGDADYCSVSTSTTIAVVDKKFTIADMTAKAAVGNVKVDGDDTHTSNNNCNVSLGGGTYTMEMKGKSLVLHYMYEGKPSQMTLVPDGEEIDLKEKTKAVASAK